MQQFADLDEVKAPEPVALQRPKFLRILCILSFIGCGIGILYFGFAFISSFLDIKMDMKIGGAKDVLGSLPDETMKEIQSWSRIQAGASFFGEFITLLGVWMMWKLKKTGFFIYAATEVVVMVVAIVVGFQTMGLMSQADLGEMGDVVKVTSIITMFSSAAADIAFIVLYAINTKHMKN